MRNGSFHILRLWGIDVFLHWSWLVVAFFEIRSTSRYDARAWNIIEYIALFGIVLVHEFGHALAARTVGGRSEQIILWPLGGLAYVQVPSRPGATLWTIAAGPLVNVAFVPILAWLGLVLGMPTGGEAQGLAAVLKAPLVMSQACLYVFSHRELFFNENVHILLSWVRDNPSDLHSFVIWISVINLALLVFNLLPAYPLDGGRIFQSLLWFVVGRPTSLAIAGLVGVVLSIAIGLWGLRDGDIMRMVIAVFLGTNAWSAFVNRSVPDSQDSPAPGPQQR